MEFFEWVIAMNFQLGLFVSEKTITRVVDKIFSSSHSFRKGQIKKLQKRAQGSLQADYSKSTNSNEI